MNKLKGFVTSLSTKAKYAVATAGAGCTAAVTSIVSSAEDASGTDLSNYTDQIVTQFTGAAEDIIPIIIGVMGAGLTIFVIFLGIRFGKKMFNTVSK